MKKFILTALASLPVISLLKGEPQSILIFSVFVLVWLFAPKIKPIVNAISLSHTAKFILAGIFSSILTEYFVFQEHFEVFSEHIMLNFLLALGIYIPLVILWHFLLKRYVFSLPQLFATVGIWGIVVEQNFAVLLSFNPLAYLFIFMVYGSIIAIPFLLAGDNFVLYQRKITNKKYIIAFLTQFLAWGIGFLWIAALQAISSI